VYRLKLICLFFPFIFANIYSQKIEIKSLKAFSDNETSLPIVFSKEQLNIEFDIKSDYEPNLIIVFRFCDRNWKPYQNIFLLNYGKNIEYNLNFELLPSTVLDARYHYEGSIPNKNNYVDFPFSGKWMFYITDVQDTSKVFASGKFYVISSNVTLNATKKNEVLEDKVYSPPVLGKIFNITSNFYLPEEYSPSFVDHVEIIENQKIYYPFIVNRNFNTNTRQYYWDGNRNFSFTARDIQPGNEYRETDLRNFNIYNRKDVPAHFDGMEYSRFYKEGSKDLNGGSKYLFYNNDYADYLNVTFKMRPPDNSFQNIFLVGAFNNWQVLPGYQMINTGGVFSKTITLKRGIYDYEYVAADLIRNNIENEDWFVFEGNFWETSNVYYVFLYYNDPNYGGYDRIIGYQKLITQ
jgi:Type 9 secretion system plug protein 1st domain